MKYKKGVFVNYQMAEAIKLLDKYDISDDNGRKLAETELQGLKDRWTTQDKIPGYGIIIGNKNAGMDDITLDEISKFATDIKQADTYSTECIGNMQYCLVRDENGNVDFDFSYLSHIADLAKANRKQLIIDSAVVFGDRFPENMANMSQEEVANVISIYIQIIINKLISNITAESITYYAHIYDLESNEEYLIVQYIVLVAIIYIINLIRQKIITNRLNKELNKSIN